MLKRSQINYTVGIAKRVFAELGLNMVVVLCFFG